MGTADSKFSELLEQSGWLPPELAHEFHHPALVNYLQEQNLEVILPKHAPQADLSISDKKPSMYPRPNFCWEAYKMHLALIGPSTACKNQVASFLPKLASVFRGPAAKLAPGRDAVPYYFFDPELHKIIVWELPEISWNQKVEDYIREIGLLYMDCVFILFSEKYLLNDTYCKLVVHMAIHGIPFFVLCTDSSEAHDEATMDRIKSYFQRKDIQGIKMLNPHKPGVQFHALLSEFFKEISWNRSSIDKERTAGVSDVVLGQTVRLKNLEKKPELNGRCGVCVGFDKEQSRYHVRLITGGVESDVALKDTSFSVLKPKMLEAMVLIKDLESRPELNGRYGFVDAFLRETERYRVFVPDQPGVGLVLALKGANLERVEETKGWHIRPPRLETASMTTANATKATRPAYGPYVADSTGGQIWKVVGGESKGGISVRKGKGFDSLLEQQRLSHVALVEELELQGERLRYRLLYGSGPSSGWVSLRFNEKVLLVRSNEVVCGSRTSRAVAPSAPPPEREDKRSVGPFDESASDKSAVDSFDRSSGEKPIVATAARPACDKPTYAKGGGAFSRRAPTESLAYADAKAAAWSSPEFPAKQEDADNLMNRILKAEENEKVAWNAESDACIERGFNIGSDLADAIHRETKNRFSKSSEVMQAPLEDDDDEGEDIAAQDEIAAPVRARLKKRGLLAMKVWAVVGDRSSEEMEDITDHLMDCGRTVLIVCPDGGHFASILELNNIPGLPKVEVLAFVDPREDPGSGAIAAARLGLKGVLLHPGAAAFPVGTLAQCQAAGLSVFEGNLLEEVEPGSGLPIAPLD